MANAPNHQLNMAAGDPNLWKSAMPLDPAGGPAAPTGSLQMGQASRNNSTSVNQSTAGWRGAQKCDMGPRKHRIGSDGTLASFPVFLVDHSAQQSWPGRDAAVNIGPRRPGGMPKMSKEVIESMRKELPRSLTPDDSLFLGDSQHDAQLDRSLGQNAAANRSRSANPQQPNNAQQPAQQPSVNVAQ